MAKAYNIAHCNIAATGATDSNEGLFFKRDPKNFNPVVSVTEVNLARVTRALEGEVKGG